MGSPVAGKWGLPGDWSTLPSYPHHRLVKATPGNDWAVDITNVPASDPGVHVYAAPSNAAYNNRVTARVTQIIDDNALTISRWGSWIGNVATSASGGPNCWTGPHVHFEMRAESHYALPCHRLGLRSRCA